MSDIKKENYINICGWMVTDLCLKGNELLIYAIIYGFSQAEKQVFNGSLQYLANWTNSTKQGVIKSLKSLEAKGFICKKENYINGVKFCEYYTTELNDILNKSEHPIKQSLTGGIKQSLHNSDNSNNQDDNDNENKESKKVRKKRTSYARESYEELMERRSVSAIFKEMLRKFIQHCKANKHILTNDKLEDIILRLNRYYGEDEQAKLQSLRNAISGNYFDVVELREAPDGYRY